MLHPRMWHRILRAGNQKSVLAADDWMQHIFKNNFGQPAAQTHPHLIKEGEVTPGVTQAEYKARRAKLVELACRSLRDKTVKDHILIFPSAAKSYMTNDIPYVFRQNSDFLYMCGFQEPDSVLVIHTKKESKEHCSLLFVPKRDPGKEKWDGARSGVEGAIQLTAVDEAFETEELGQFLSYFARKNLFFALWYNSVKPPHPDLHDAHILNFLNENAHTVLENSTRLTSHLRLLKSPAEIALLKKSTQIASESFIEVMKFSHPEVNEAHLYAKMDFECRLRNAEFLAYPPVVAGGSRACTIHYISNNQIVHDGDLVLMDAGCECHGYASDITRTWPVSGRFSPSQKALYDAVLRTQLLCISLSVVRNSLEDVYREMLIHLGKELQALNIISHSQQSTELLRRVRELCPHHVGHFLGMDVHDTQEISRSVKLHPGMVITIEPGVYIAETDTDVPAEFRGIGIRIEDNILITKTDPVILTDRCPKNIDDIEALMAR